MSHFREGPERKVTPETRQLFIVRSQVVDSADARIERVLRSTFPNQELANVAPEVPAPQTVPNNVLQVGERLVQAGLNDYAAQLDTINQIHDQAVTGGMNDVPEAV